MAIISIIVRFRRNAKNIRTCVTLFESKRDFRVSTPYLHSYGFRASRDDPNQIALPKAASPNPLVAANLFVFMAENFRVNYFSMGCDVLLDVANPVTLTEVNDGDLKIMKATVRNVNEQAKVNVETLIDPYMIAIAGPAGAGAGIVPGGGNIVLIVLSALGGLIVAGAGYACYQRQKKAADGGKSAPPPSDAGHRYEPVGAGNHQVELLDEAASGSGSGSGRESPRIAVKSAPVPVAVRAGAGARIAVPFGSSSPSNASGSFGSSTQKIAVSLQRLAGGGSYAAPQPPAERDYGETFTGGSTSGRRSPRAQSPKRSAPRM